MPARRSELTRQAKEDLMLYIALNGENYDKYKAFCAQRGYYVFTPHYLHNWVGRHRDAIVALRTTHTETVKQASEYDRKKRLTGLERNAERLQERIDAVLEDPNNSDELLIKLMEQHRKLMETIAKERGEWLKADTGRSDLDEIHGEIAKALRAGFGRMSKALPGPVVEGTFTEVSVAAP